MTATMHEPLSSTLHVLVYSAERSTDISLAFDSVYIAIT